MRRHHVTLGRIFFLLTSIFVLPLLLTACGSGGSGNSGSTNAGGTNSSIGPNGGTVESTDGRAKIVIPAGALSQDTNVTITQASNPPAGNIGTAYEFDPDGTAFNQPVSISLTYDESSLPSGVNEADLKLETVTNGQWEVIANSTVDTTGNVVSGTTSHLSIYGVAANNNGFSTSRGHTATRLSNGKVLVIQGNASVLYDAASDTFTPPGSMTTSRSFHTATLLLNGKILIAGGINSSDLNTAELYDPATGTFTATGSMTIARSAHTATLLPNGKVLIVGGSFNNTAELYDPTTGTFTITGSMSVARSFHMATLLGNGKVLVTGGYAESLVILKSAESYDPATGTFSSAGSMTIPRYGHTVTLLNDGTVLIAGGFSNNHVNSSSTAEFYNPATSVFTAIGSMDSPRTFHTATLLDDGKVLIAGGINLQFSPLTNIKLSSTVLYDPVNKTFGPMGSMTTSRYGHSAILLNNGKILIIGGGNSVYELYSVTTEPTGGTFTDTGKMNRSRSEHTATLLSNGKVLITGGMYPQEGSAELFDAVTGTFSYTGNMTAGRTRNTATLLPNGKVLITGGETIDPLPIGNLVIHSSAEIYDPATGTFSLTGSMTVPRTRHSAILLPNGKVLITGGQSFSSPAFVTLGSAELYDPDSGIFSSIGNMTTHRWDHTAVLLPNGKVLIVGSWKTGDLYDPITNTFSATGDMSAIRSDPSATLLPNSKVLILGGGFPTAELFDPETSTFSNTNNLNISRSGHTATLLPNNQVLIVGGGSETSEIYNPDTGAFTLTDSMSMKRQWPTATSMPDDDVLITGGAVNGSSVNAAEIYHVPK